MAHALFLLGNGHVDARCQKLNFCNPVSFFHTQSHGDAKNPK